MATSAAGLEFAGVSLSALVMEMPSLVTTLIHKCGLLMTIRGF